MNQLLSSILYKKTGIVPVTVITIIYGISWGFIYLIFTAFHYNTEMFNDEFMLTLAGILDIQLNTIGRGFLFTFFEGSLFGFLIGVLLLRIYRKNDDEPTTDAKKEKGYWHHQ